MKIVITIILVSITFVYPSTQGWLEKVAKEAQKLSNKEIEKRQMEMTGEGASQVTSLDEAKKSLLGEVWVFGDEENRTAYIFRFSEVGDFEKQFLKKRFKQM